VLTGRAGTAAPSPVQPVQPSPLPSYGVYNCKMLEEIWIQEGGNPGASFLAAEIATAESGGRTYIVSPTDDYGLWQINWSHDPSDPEKYLNPVVNTRAAISISSDGTNWTAWTTYTKGLYIGMCL
jgi:hypothetical protein